MKLQLIILLALLGVGVFTYFSVLAHVIVYDFQKGLLYKKGAFIKVLSAGKYRYLRSSSDIQVIDTRKTLLTLPGQEILTKDNIGLKLSLCGLFEITDPVKAQHSSQNYYNEIYALAQIALREIVAGYEIDELLEKKNELDAQLLEKVKPGAEEIGVTFSTLAVRDVMLPASLKRAFSGILEARKEALTQLEKARGEQAVLRNLANSAGLYDTTPQLLQARIIQTLSKGNNSIVFGTNDQSIVTKNKV